MPRRGGIDMMQCVLCKGMVQKGAPYYFSAEFGEAMHGDCYDTFRERDGKESRPSVPRA
jgi:hypothetical protein